MSINAMITEDDLLSRTLLCDLLEDYFPEVNVVGMFLNVKDSVEFLKNHKIDLLFLDVELPDGIGLDILQSILNVDFTVIITTSFVKYTEESGLPNIIYSIIKPLTKDSLVNAMDRYWENK